MSTEALTPEVIRGREIPAKRFDPRSGEIVNRDDNSQLIPYNYLVFGINRYEGTPARDSSALRAFRRGFRAADARLASSNSSASTRCGKMSRSCRLLG